MPALGGRDGGGTLRLCVSRPAEDVILGQTLQLREQMGLGNLTLLGDAHGLRGVTAALNHPLLTSTGSLVVQPPPLDTRALPFFRATFDVEVKNSLKGEGFSLSYGSQVADEEPAGAYGVPSTGLAIAFLQWPECELRVTFRAKLLHRRILEDTPDLGSGRCWLTTTGAARLIVAFNSSGLLVHSDVKGLLVDGMPLPAAFAPRRSWKMVFGASSGRHPASVQLVDALLDFGARMTPLPASVELAQNGQQFSTDAVAFTYYRLRSSQASCPPTGQRRATRGSSSLAPTCHAARTTSASLATPRPRRRTWRIARRSPAARRTTGRAGRRTCACHSTASSSPPPPCRISSTSCLRSAGSHPRLVRRRAAHTYGSTPGASKGAPPTSVALAAPLLPPCTPRTSRCARVSRAFRRRATAASPYRSRWQPTAKTFRAVGRPSPIDRTRHSESAHCSPRAASSSAVLPSLCLARALSETPPAAAASAVRNSTRATRRTTTRGAALLRSRAVRERAAGRVHVPPALHAARSRQQLLNLSKSDGHELLGDANPTLDGKAVRLTAAKPAQSGALRLIRADTWRAVRLSL